MSAPADDSLRLVDARERRRYEILSDQEPQPVAFVDYDLRHDLVLLMHTEVREDLEGRGIGSRTAQLVVDHVRVSGRKAIVGCPFLIAWLRRHPDQQEILARPLRDRTTEARAADTVNRAGGA